MTPKEDLLHQLCARQRYDQANYYFLRTLEVHRKGDHERAARISSHTRALLFTLIDMNRKEAQNG